MLEEGYKLKENIVPNNNVNKVSMVQVMIVNIWIKHTQ